MEKIKQQLKEILVVDLKIQGVAMEDIDDAGQLFGEGLGLDSLDAVELAFLVEKRFGVTIADMEEGKAVFESINALAQFIETQMK